MVLKCRIYVAFKYEIALKNEDKTKHYNGVNFGVLNQHLSDNIYLQKNRIKLFVIPLQEEWGRI